MKADRIMLAVPAILLCLAGGGLAITACGDDGEQAAHAAARPTATATAAAPLVVPLRPAHRSGVRGTATLAPAGDSVKVTLKLSKPVKGSLLAHIHWGPCSKEPTFSNPRIWANLTEVVDGTSETTENVVTLKELQSEDASINVHDPTHGNRPLVCGDIPRAG